MKTIYVGMALTDAPKEFRNRFQTELKNQLRSLPEIEVLDFVGLENGSEVDVYEYDRACTESCDLMVAICDYSSLGLGMELVFRYHTGKPLVLFAHKDEYVSRMVTGFTQKENIPYHHFDTVADIIEVVKLELAKL